MLLLRRHSRMFAPPTLKNLYSVVMLFFLSNSVGAGKSRQWLGPDNFIEGNFPSARMQHGFTATEDNKTYVFGGIKSSGTFEDAARYDRDTCGFERCGSTCVLVSNI
jgi:hypothetical protein